MITRKPTRALVGEAGPELFAPVAALMGRPHLPESTVIRHPAPCLCDPQQWRGFSDWLVSVLMLLAVVGFCGLVLWVSAGR